MDINKKIRKARFKFIQAKPFWSNILGIPYEFDDIETQCCSTDGKAFYLNPNYINETEIDDLQLDFAHEYLHLLLGHTIDKRFKSVKGNPNKFYIANLAADYVVNSIIKEEFKREVKDGYYDPQFGHMTFEQVYHFLNKEGDNQTKERLESKDSPWNNGEGSNPSSSPSSNPQNNEESLEDILDDLLGDDKDDKGKEKEKGSNKSESGKDIKNKNQQREYFKDHKKWEHDNKKESPIITMLRNTLMGAHLRGDLPAGLEREVQNILHPAIPIRDVISSFVLEKSQSKQTWKRMKRRFYPPIYLPKRGQKQKLHIGVAIDTSGSVDVDMLSEFKAGMGYLFSFFRNNLEVIVFQADAAIQGEDVIREPEDMEKIKWKGGGGTDFNPVFDRMREEHPELRGLIYITDTDGKFPDKELSFPTVWLVPEKERKYHHKPPFGKLIFYEGAVCKS
ncbi:MAG: hypothetical protein KAX49_14065 [Halanaerobiales bacterium]|nr:hypothetical protein [Halanaerobiales bacterium]